MNTFHIHRVGKVRANIDHFPADPRRSEFWILNIVTDDNMHVAFFLHHAPSEALQDFILKCGGLLHDGPDDKPATPPESEV